MEKMIKKTSSEIRREWTPAKIAELKSSDFAFDKSDIADADMTVGKVKRVGRGFAAFRENINLYGRPRAERKKTVVTICLPNDLVSDMRRSRGYSRVISDYVMDGISRGKLNIPTLRRQA
jgi:hypothetical protein